MIPSTLLGVGVFLVGVSPGYLYLRLFERFVPRGARTPTREVAEIVTVGSLSTVLAALLVLVAGQLWTAFLPLEGALRGAGYLRAHPWQVLASGLTGWALSLLVCVAAGWWSGRRLGGGQARVGVGTIWGHAVARTSSDRTRPYLAVHLADGQMIEGFLQEVSSTEDPAQRELLLRAPIALSSAASPRTRLATDFSIVPAASIRLVFLRREPVTRRGGDPGASRRRRRWPAWLRLPPVPSPAAPPGPDPTGPLTGSP